MLRGGVDSFGSQRRGTSAVVSVAVVRQSIMHHHPLRVGAVSRRLNLSTVNVFSIILLVIPLVFRTPTCLEIEWGPFWSRKGQDHSVTIYIAVGNFGERHSKGRRKIVSKPLTIPLNPVHVWITTPL